MNSWNIRGDLHVHAHHTNCDHHKPGDPVDYHDAFCGRGAIREMREYLKNENFFYAAIVNHATDPKEPVPVSPESEEKIAHHIKYVAEANEERTPDAPLLLAGIEVSVLPDGGLDVSHEKLCQLDINILSRHAGTTSWDIPKTIAVLEPLFAKHPIHVLGHPTRYSPPETLVGIENLLALCKKYEVAFELNAYHPFGVEQVQRVLQSEVLITLGSDIHLNALGDPKSKKSIRDIKEIVQLQDAGFPKNRLINTWPFQKVDKWLLSRKKMCNV
ncbi:MAG: hypothetical protein WCV86_01210 [Patescibacteria group bacterium]|jgi:histidinol phosphatase-like PHP family hydrolase